MDFLEIFQLHAPLKHKAKQIKTRNGSNVQRDLDRLNTLHVVINGTDPNIQIFSTGDYEAVSDMELKVFAELNGLICKWHINLESLDDQDIQAALMFDSTIIQESACTITATQNQKVYLSGFFEYFGPANNYHAMNIVVKTETGKSVRTIGLNRGLTCQEKDIPLITESPQQFGWRV